MKRLALLLAIVLAGCSHGSNGVMPAPSQSILAIHPQIGGFTYYTLATPVGFEAVGGHDNCIYGDTSINAVVKIDMAGNETLIPLSGSTNIGAYDTITPNPNGDIYTIERMNGGTYDVAQVDQAGVVVEYPLPFTDQPIGMVTGSDTNLWIVHANGIGRMTTGGVYTDFGGGPFGNTFGARIVRGPDKNIWVNAPNTLQNQMVRVSVADGTQAVFALPSDAYGLTQGPDGNLYLLGSTMMYQYDMNDNGINRYALVPHPSGVVMVSGPNSRLFWSDRSKVFSFNVRTFKIQNRVQAGFSSNLIAMAPDHNSLWLFGAQEAEVLTLHVH